MAHPPVVGTHGDDVLFLIVNRAGASTSEPPLKGMGMRISGQKHRNGAKFYSLVLLAILWSLAGSAFADEPLGKDALESAIKGNTAEGKFLNFVIDMGSQCPGCPLCKKNGVISRTRQTYSGYYSQC